KLAEALAAVHRAGIIHRDVTPANVMVGDDGEPYLMDFGIALSTEEVRGGITASVPALARPIDTSTVAGTEGRMAPESEGGRIDHRADVFQLGLLIYESLAGLRHRNSPMPTQKQARALPYPFGP